METTMELDELKQTWQKLGERLERQESINWQLLKANRLDKTRSHLRPLFWWQLLQSLLGVFLIVLGVACWTGNFQLPGLLLSGILVHAFGVANVALASITLALAATVDYAAPVLRIQKRLALLLRLHSVNAAVCGWPWWIMWLPVVVAFAGLGDHPVEVGTPLWVWASLTASVVGLLGTWAYQLRRIRHDSTNADQPRCDGSDGIRRSQRVLEEIAQFEGK